MIEMVQETVHVQQSHCMDKVVDVLIAMPR